MAEETTEETEIVERKDNGEVPANQSDTAPMRLIEKAIDRDADIEVLERLFDLQERAEEHEARKAFDAAMADLRDDLPKIVKNRKVDYDSKAGRTEYEYEDLSSITEQVSPVMAEHDLSFRWRTDSETKNEVKVTCIISHRDGHSEETTLSAEPDTSGGKNSIQAIGSTLTYLQRYTLKAALGVAAAPDDDGQAAGNDTSGEFSTDPDEVSPPNFDNYEEYDTVSDLPDDELVYLKDYLTGDKLEGEYAQENKALRKAVLNEIKKRKEKRKAEKNNSSSEPDREITNAALNLARKEGVLKHVLQDMEGTGKDGRIVKGDIQAYLSKQEIGNSEDDSSEELTLNDAMSTIMDDCSELIDDTSASISEIRETLQELGVTESNLDRLIEHLTDIQAGTKSYETEDGVIQLD